MSRFRALAVLVLGLLAGCREGAPTLDGCRQGLSRFSDSCLSGESSSGLISEADPLAPTLTSIASLAGATEDMAYTITYATLAGAADESDPSGMPVSFKLSALSLGTLTQGGSAISAGATLSAGGDPWIWTPPANANGVLGAMTIVASNGTLDSSTPRQVRIVTTAVNDPPTLTAVATLAGTTRNAAYTISYSALQAAANEADVEADLLSFRVEAVSTGTLTQSGAAVTAGLTLLTSSSNPLVWTPASQASGSALNAFTVRAWDGSAASTINVQVTVAVTANTRPTLTAINTLTQGVEDTSFTISFAALQSAADEVDLNGDVISFKIMSITSGTLTKVGAPVTPGSTLFGTGETLVWTPQADANGNLNAFTVAAHDGLSDSITQSQVRVAVTSVNDPPTLNVIANPSAINEDSGAQSVALTGITLGPLNETGTLTLTASSSNTALIPHPSVTYVSPNPTGTLSYTPAPNASGTATITVTVGDGALNAIRTFTVTVSPVNDAPTLSAINTLVGGIQNTAFTITYTDLQTASNEADVDSPALRFVLDDLSQGTLTLNGSPVTSGGSVLSSTSGPWVWTPPLDMTGTLGAFTIRADDGALASGSPVQVNVAVLKNTGVAFKKVRVSGAHTCAIDIDDALYCWGANTYGQLGDGTIIQKLSPILISSGHRFSEVSSGAEHTCGITLAGDLMCWGRNYYGQIGDGTNVTRLVPMLIDPGTSYQQIVAGYQRTCGVTSAGLLKCWGMGGATLPTLMDPGTSYVEVATQFLHTCALTTAGAVKCWGGNSYGEAAPSSAHTQIGTPTVIVTDQTFKRVSVGVFFSCAVNLSDRPYCWGTGSSGVLARNTAGSGVQEANLLPDVQRMRLGFVQGLALGIGGGLLGWGNNFRGTLTPGFQAALGPQQILSSMSFQDLDTGGEHTCAVTQSGELWCWGLNTYGQIGNGATSTGATPSPWRVPHP